MSTSAWVSAVERARMANLNAEALAEVLALSGAVNVGDDHLVAGGELLSKRVPSGLHALAMASPGASAQKVGLDERMCMAECKNVLQRLTKAPKT